MASYFHSIRNEMIHEGLNPLEGYTRGMTTDFYLREDAPERSAVIAGSSYMSVLVRIAGMAYRRYWTSIDMSTAVTPEDLTARGQTIEDVEEEFGLPRGWSARLPPSERLALMKEYSKTRIEDLERRYPALPLE